MRSSVRHTVPEVIKLDGMDTLPSQPGVIKWKRCCDNPVPGMSGFTRGAGLMGARLACERCQTELGQFTWRDHDNQFTRLFSHGRQDPVIRA